MAAWSRDVRTGAPHICVDRKLRLAPQHRAAKKCGAAPVRGCPRSGLERRRRSSGDSAVAAPPLCREDKGAKRRQRDAARNLRAVCRIHPAAIPQQIVTGDFNEEDRHAVRRLREPAGCSVGAAVGAGVDEAEARARDAQNRSGWRQALHAQVGGRRQRGSSRGVVRFDGLDIAITMVLRRAEQHDSRAVAIPRLGRRADCMRIAVRAERPEHRR